MKVSARPLLLIMSLLLLACNSRKKINMLVHHAVIYTADKGFTIQEAMAIDDGKIIAVGSNEQLLQRYAATTTIDAKGDFIYPGFIDAHCHFTGYATDMWKCDLTGTRSFEEVIGKIKEYAATATTSWLYGRGWDQNDWPEKKFPTRQQLDALFGERPVFLKRIDGHAALVNLAALRLAGIDATTKVAGGSIELQNGVPTGLLIDNAMDLVEKKIPLITDALAVKYLVQAQDSCFQFGLTGVHDCGVSEHTIQLVDGAQREGKLTMKIFALLSDSVQYYDRWLKKGVYKTPSLHVGGFKLYADGALGSRGACLLQPYSDKKDWYGFLLSDTSHFASVARMLVNSNFQLCTHAIGDSGNRVILKLYAEVLKGKNDKRWRVEHAQVVSDADIAMFQQYTIIPSVQPTHATSDMYWAEERLGSQRIHTAYAYKKLLDENGWIILGTDFPVESINPFKTFYAAVERKDSNGYPAGGFQMTNALTRKEALMGMTAWAARGAFEEDEKGSLEPGKAADFFIADRNLLTCPSADILSTQVQATFVNGKKVFSR